MRGRDAVIKSIPKVNTTRNRMVRTECKEWDEPAKEDHTYKLTNIQDGNIGVHLQVPRGGTHPNGVRSELTIFITQIFFKKLVSFTADSVCA